jgi:rod shape-determining protein MreC
MVQAAKKLQGLEEEVARLQSEVIRLSEFELENQRLTALLNYRQTMVRQYDFIAATVIGRDPGNWFGTITLNRGARDGVMENMTVLTPEGLVGRTISVSQATCEVLLITDPRSGVGALVQENRAPGIVDGTAASAGLAKMVHIPNGAEVVFGQAVVTSGIGSIFPKAIPVGTVVGIKSEPSGLFKSADIQPYAPLDRLEEVLVVTVVNRVYSETVQR